MNLSTQTPVEIDTQIAAIYVRWYAQVREVTKVGGWLEDAERNLAEAKGEVKPRYGRSSYSERDVPRLEKSVADLLDRLETEQATAAEIMRETAPFNAEFKARGGWTRFYLVDNAGGHVHKSMTCSSCYDTRMVNGRLVAGTQFIWLPEESGQTEAEIVEKANEQACTVCFPSAPVDKSRKGIYEAPARKAAREEREKAAAERQAKKVAKSLSLDGEEVTIVVAEGVYGDDHYNVRTRGQAWKKYEHFKAFTTAMSWVVDQTAGPQTWRRGGAVEYPEAVAEVTRLMALKRGVTVEEIQAEIDAKVAKKVKAFFR